MKNVLVHMVYILVIATLAGIIKSNPPEVKKDVQVVDKVEKRCIVSKYQPGTFESAAKRTD